MKKTLLHRLFGWGRIPKRYVSRLRDEGIILLDEGIGGSITLKQFRAPGRYNYWKRSWFIGSIVLTDRTFAAFAFFKPIIYVPLDHENISELSCTLEGGDTLIVKYGASAFNEKRSGAIECRFKTSKAEMFCQWLTQRKSIGGRREA
ncbi:hypothetical protein ACFL0G_05805 [Candidatus Zixiibacteriota bacterium]